MEEGNLSEVTTSGAISVNRATTSAAGKSTTKKVGDEERSNHPVHGAFWGIVDGSSGSGKIGVERRRKSGRYIFH